MGSASVAPHPALVAAPRTWISTRSVRNGLIGAIVMAAFYLVVVAGASRSWAHVIDQARQDKYYLTAIIAGFGAQIALTSEIRRHHRARSTLASGGVGAGAATAGMVACCAHHLADLLPLVGVATAATFLSDHRVEFMVTGIILNAAAVTIATLQLHRLRTRSW